MFLILLYNYKQYMFQMWMNFMSDSDKYLPRSLQYLYVIFDRWSLVLHHELKPYSLYFELIYHSTFLYPNNLIA